MPFMAGPLPSPGSILPTLCLPPAAAPAAPAPMGWASPNHQQQQGRQRLPAPSGCAGARFLSSRATLPWCFSFSFLIHRQFILSSWIVSISVNPVTLFCLLPFAFFQQIPPPVRCHYHCLDGYMDSTWWRRFLDSNPSTEEWLFRQRAPGAQRSGKSIATFFPHILSAGLTHIQLSSTF